MAGDEIYDFGGFVLDVGERRLRAGTLTPQLAPKAFDLLVALVRKAGRLVTKDELLDTVWSDAHVEEGILAVHVSSLRKALGDRAHEVIETVSRAGYRFAAPVTRRARQPEPFPMRWPIGIIAGRPEVYELIGRGRAHLLTTSMAEIPKAVEAFQSAIDLDPDYAAAHAGLARACCAQAELRMVPHADAYGEARTAALRALALDDGCADAKVALGAVMFLSDWNWMGARRSLERALEIDPDHTEAYLLYGRLLEALGELDRALAVKQKALEREPHSALVHIQIALSYWNQRRYDETITWAGRALELDPRHLLAREYIAGAYWKMGDFDRQMDESLRHAEVFGAPAALLDELRQAYAGGGRRAVVEWTLARTSDASANPAQMALLYGEVGLLDEAFRHLDAAIDRRDPILVHLAVAPQWDSLRGDPRWHERLARMGLPALSRAPST